MRREFIAEAVGCGWKIASADTGFVELEVGERWQMTGWFVNGQLGMIALFDATTGATQQLLPPCSVPSPSAAARLLGSR